MLAGSLPGSGADGRGPVVRPGRGRRPVPSRSLRLGCGGRHRRGTAKRFLRLGLTGGGGGGIWGLGYGRGLARGEAGGRRDLIRRGRGGGGGDVRGLSHGRGLARGEAGGWKDYVRHGRGWWWTLQDHSSIFTAEARAILLALECIEHSNRKRFLIFTDSMSCLQALDLKIDHPIIEEIISKLMSLKASGFDIHLCWLPGHVGIHHSLTHSLVTSVPIEPPKRRAEPTCSPVSSHPRILNPSFANTSPPYGRARGTSHH